VTAITTVGYGDLIPSSLIGMIIAAISIVFGVLVNIFKIQVLFLISYVLFWLKATIASCSHHWKQFLRDLFGKSEERLRQKKVKHKEALRRYLKSR